MSNTIANLVGQSWSAVLSVLLVPFYIHVLGVDAYGLIGFLASLQAMVGLLDMGLSTTINREMARRSEHGSTGISVRTIVRTFQSLYTAIGVAMALGVVAAAPWVARGWLRSDTLPVATIQTAVVVFGVTMAVRWPIALCVGILRGLERHVLFNWLTIGIVTARGIGSILVLLLVSQTLIALLLWHLLVALVEVGLLGVVTSRALPVAPDDVWFAVRALRDVWRFSVGVGVISFFAVVLKQLDKLVIGWLLPLEDLGYYTAATTASRGLLLLPAAVFNAVFPKFSTLVARGDVPMLARLYHRASVLVTFAVAPAAGFCMFFGREILAAWTRSEIVAERAQVALAILAFATMLNAAMQIPYALQLAAGLTRIPLWNNGISAALLGPTIYFLVAYYGTSGAALAWALFNCAYFAVIPWVTHRALLPGHQRTWLVRDTLPFLVLSVLLFGGARLLPIPSEAVAWVAALLAGLAYLILAIRIDPTLLSYLRVWRIVLADSGLAREQGRVEPEGHDRREPERGEAGDGPGAPH